MRTPPFYRVARHFPVALWRAYEGWLIRTEDRWNTPEPDSDYWDDPLNGIPLTGDYNLRKRASWQKMDTIGGRGPVLGRGNPNIKPPTWDRPRSKAYEQCRAMLVDEILEVAAKQGVTVNKADIIFEVADDVKWNETGYGLHTMIATCKTEAGKLGAKRSFLSRGILDE